MSLVYAMTAKITTHVGAESIRGRKKASSGLMMMMMRRASSRNAFCMCVGVVGATIRCTRPDRRLSGRAEWVGAWTKWVVSKLTMCEQIIPSTRTKASSVCLDATPPCWRGGGINTYVLCKDSSVCVCVCSICGAEQ